MKLGLAYSRIRRDEKALLAELRDRGHDVRKIDVREEQFDLAEPPESFEGLDLLLDRCLSTSRSVYLTRFCASYGLPVVNGTRTAFACADKVETSLALADADVPTPATTVAFTEEAALAAIEAFGYPCVLKPVVGSWGRLLAKIESRSAAEAILEHKSTLGHYEHSIFYIQEFVDKPGRDVRVLAADGEPIAAMVRSGDHWVTNAARGADTEPFEVDQTVASVVTAASDAVGGGLLGVDLMETGDGSGSESEGNDAFEDCGYTVHEINHTVEFGALADTVDVDVPAAIVDWLETVAADASADDAEVTV